MYLTARHAKGYCRRARGAQSCTEESDDVKVHCTRIARRGSGTPCHTADRVFRCAKPHNVGQGRSHPHRNSTARSHGCAYAYAHHGSDTHAHSHTYARHGSDTHAHAGANAYPHIGSDTHAHAGANAYPHIGPDTHAHAGANAYPHHGPDKHAHAGADACSNALIP